MCLLIGFYYFWLNTAMPTFLAHAQEAMVILSGVAGLTAVVMVPWTITLFTLRKI